MRVVGETCGGREEWDTFVWATSESAGTLPPSFFLDTWDSAFRRSSRVMWKVDSDMVVEGDS